MATLPMPDRDALSPDAQAVYDRMVATRGRIDGMYRTLLNHPALAAHVSELGTYFRFGPSVLPAQVRELVILWTGRKCGAAYEWVKHFPVARQAGIPESVLEEVRLGRRPTELSPVQSAALDAADAALAPASIPQATQDVLEAALTRQGLIEIVVLCGLYRLIAGVLFAFDVPLPEGATQPF
ncbi:Carboxymuconolactone decarboxylase [Solidesulfovibrio fructosivorans JJ]]|uniref:Carboxymuconolactone decarboxylase n=1 Tax=Solidesulfovibrio fructosivorans JJ] TaxID=596151 RepID=E1K1P6_SOLFR|nr:carboxymuconolactone decarboxylase family protein [Solidesulfovibrio fructosivorans]EFL49484.1 Carboxymuconolactone decarboxylase [Solidesulfovibrio fructosivorans JJ]]